MTKSIATRALRGVASAPTVAVLYQARDPPPVNGARKPSKAGGYQDSGADIAYTLRRNGVRVLTPIAATPNVQEGWCYPDTEDGILAAVQQGATHLWANTSLYASHPLQVSRKLGEYGSKLSIMGQPPALVDSLDDKGYLNSRLRDLGVFTLPKFMVLRSEYDVPSVLRSLRYPIVGKPVRGRGSQGVKVCNDLAQLEAHSETLFQDSTAIMLEEFLEGEEATITVMPPAPDQPLHYSLPPVKRFNQVNGVAPYNQVVAVITNSRAITPDEMEDPAYHAVMRECEQIARLIKSTAPIRIDVRRFKENSSFAIFDINMKPNMTGPGRPGRQDKASLTALAAEAIGWDYATLLQKILASATRLDQLRAYQSPFSR